jgi:PAS domain S-box-containing protein
LSLFSLRTEPGSSPCSVAIARPAGRPSSERSALLDDAPQAILAVDAEGFVATANPAAEQLLGIGSEALQGCALAALAEDSEGLESLLQAFEGSTTGEFAVKLRSSQTGSVAAIALAAPRRGEATGVVVTLRPDDRATESELARRNDELEHCVNTLAHDLRSPLVALLGFSRLLRQDFGDLLDDTGGHFIDRIEKAARMMESLIHDLLELSRIGKHGERARLVDPRAVLLQLGAEFKPRLDEGGIRLSLPENPPLVFCDRTRLYQVFSNLIGNAVDHMGECEDRRIVVSIAELPHLHQITVSDFGQGIEPKYVEKVFEVFQTVGARHGGRHGTGMGLAIVRKIAETHGGRAWVESHPGNGSAFHVTFPRC